MKISLLAQRIAERTQTALSADRYASWDAVAQFLLDRGYDSFATEAILRSKWTRWAADHANKSRNATSEDLRRWLVHTYPERRDELTAVRALVADTF